MSDAYPILVADIGGTHARFGIVQSSGEAPGELKTIAGKVGLVSSGISTAGSTN